MLYMGYAYHCNRNRKERIESKYPYKGRSGLNAASKPESLLHRQAGSPLVFT